MRTTDWSNSVQPPRASPAVRGLLVGAVGADLLLRHELSAMLGTAAPYLHTRGIGELVRRSLVYQHTFGPLTGSPNLIEADALAPNLRNVLVQP